MIAASSVLELGGLVDAFGAVNRRRHDGEDGARAVLHLGDGGQTRARRHHRRRRRAAEQHEGRARGRPPPAGASGPRTPASRTKPADPPNATVNPMPTDRKKPPIVDREQRRRRPTPFVPFAAVRVVLAEEHAGGDPPRVPASAVPKARVTRRVRHAFSLVSLRSPRELRGRERSARDRARFVRRIRLGVCCGGLASLESLGRARRARDDRRGAARSVPVADTARGTRHRACALDAARLVAPGVAWTRRSRTRGVRTRPRDRGRFSARRRGLQSDTYWTRLASRTDRSGGSARPPPALAPIAGGGAGTSPRGPRGASCGTATRDGLWGCAASERSFKKSRRRLGSSGGRAEASVSDFETRARDDAETPRRGGPRRVVRSPPPPPRGPPLSVSLSLSLSISLSLPQRMDPPQSAPPPPISASPLTIAATRRGGRARVFPRRRFFRVFSPGLRLAGLGASSSSPGESARLFSPRRRARSSAMNSAALVSRNRGSVGSSANFSDSNKPAKRSSAATTFC